MSAIFNDSIKFVLQLLIFSGTILSMERKFMINNFEDNTPTLYTDRLILRKFVMEDLNDIFPLYSDVTVNTFLPWFPHESIEDTAKYLQDVIFAEYIKPLAYCYAIAMKYDNKVIGYVTIHDINSATCAADLGYALSSVYWNKGIVTEACKTIIAHLRSIGFKYITATHDVNNIASGEVMKKLGMRYCYSYIEQVQPKNMKVTFKMYQLNLDGEKDRVYMGYWEKYADHFIDTDIIIE